MTEELVEKVGSAAHANLSRQDVIAYLDGDFDCHWLARDVIPVVLEEVQRHLSAVQYDPAPYTALKHRLADLANQSESV